MRKDSHHIPRRDIRPKGARNKSRDPKDGPSHIPRGAPLGRPKRNFRQDSHNYQQCDPYPQSWETLPRSWNNSSSKSGPPNYNPGFDQTNLGYYNGDTRNQIPLHNRFFPLSDLETPGRHRSGIGGYGYSGPERSPGAHYSGNFQQGHNHPRSTLWPPW